MAAAAPQEALINFETGSPTWPLQLRQMHGQTVPQDAWTLPKSSVPFSKPVAKAPYAGPALVKSGLNQWTIKAWDLQAAPEVKADGERIASSSFNPAGWHAATVPGTVLTTLIDRGVYPNPDYGLNNMAIPESLNKQDYWYRSTFATPDGYKAGQHLFVTFKGVNYAAAVWINGRRIGDMKGAFIRGTFDISPYLKPKAQNVIAVKVSPPPHPGIPQEESLTAGVGENGGVLAQDGPTFIATEGWDWIPSVRDRNTGLWQDVILRATKDVRIGDTHVLTTLTRDDNSEADISVEVPATNLSRNAVRTTLRATIADRGGSMRPIVVSKMVTLTPGENTVRFTPKEFAALKIRQPRLWWPNGYGRPDLHELKVEALQGIDLSDQVSSRFGIRAVTYELSLVDKAGQLRRVEADFNKGRALGVRITDGSHDAIRKVAGNNWVNGLRPEADGTAAIKDLPETGLTPFLVIKVNGVRIAARGGNWGMDDWLKRINRERLEPYFRLHRDAHVNVIRNWVGQNTEDVFFELADEYGLMVMNDFWASTQDYNIEPQDTALFMNNARDVVKRYRNHPSVVMWFGRNEGVPQPALNEALEALIYELDGTRWYTGSSNRVNLQNSGPYNYQPPATYFTEHAKGFSVEVGTPSFPTAEAIKAAVPEPDRWPISDTLAYHDWHPDGNGGSKPFMAALKTAFGEATSFEDFERKAQMLNLESYRAIFEGMNAGLWRENSGRMLWMTQPARPSTMWQMLSHDYDTHGAFYGVKNASEPVHVQMNLPDYRLMVINNPNAALDNATLSFVAVDVTGRQLAAGTRPVSVTAVSTSEAIDVGLGELITRHGLLVVKLTLRDSTGKLLSENAYWPSATPAGQQGLNKLADVKVGIATAWEKSAGEQKLAITLTNSAAVPVLNTKVTLLTAAGERVLPVYYSDNYVVLMPGESKTVTATFNAQGPVKVGVRAWNSKEQWSDVAPDRPVLACATNAAPRSVEYPWMSVERWKRMHVDQLAIADQGGVDLMFVGDSITEGWPKATWDSSFGKYKPANFGIGGDHTGTVLWRLQDNRLARLKPRAIVLLIGVNNIGLCDEGAETVFTGVKAVVASLRRQYPSARILLNSILPADETAQGERRRRIVALNKLVATLDQKPHVNVVDYGPLFLQADGSIPKDIMADSLHLTEKGYAIWARAMRPDIDRLMK
jgi:lysophospholipase L1-like esterase